jgi:hypothetical protein
MTGLCASTPPIENDNYRWSNQGLGAGEKTTQKVLDMLLKYTAGGHYRIIRTAEALGRSVDPVDRDAAMVPPCTT